MRGEYLSIETAKRIASLEKENKNLLDVIKHVYEYVDKKLFAEYVQVKELKKILNINGDDNAKTI